MILEVTIAVQGLVVRSLAGIPLPTAARLREPRLANGLADALSRVHSGHQASIFAPSAWLLYHKDHSLPKVCIYQLLFKSCIQVFDRMLWMVMCMQCCFYAAVNEKSMTVLTFVMSFVYS